MNELNRQAYLAALGLENYMPRWRLPEAPEPYACVLPEIQLVQVLTHSDAPSVSAAASLERQFVSPPNKGIAEEVLAAFSAPAPKLDKSPVGFDAASILAQLEKPKAAPKVQPFSLSLWRPEPGFLIIDERNTQLALPTELLLSNMLRACFGIAKSALGEEVLRWPMIENSFVSRTEIDARTELQTWLAVENELRPITRLWLMGHNASRYLLPEATDLEAVKWNLWTLAAPDIKALILPSLNQLLQQPLLKAKLWASLN
jgi:hypothetical protein